MTMDNFAAVGSITQTPGPGSYTTESHQAVGNKYSIHVNIRPSYPSKPSLTSKIDFPPETSTISRIAYTLRPKTPIHEPGSAAPGPDYFPDPRQYLSQGVAIKRRYKEGDGPNYPGPGRYSPQDWPKTRTPPMCGRDKITLSVIPDSPGPAAYDVLHEFGGVTPRFTIRPRTSLPVDRSQKPGIEHNEQSKIGEATPRWTVPKAKARRGHANETPGPGAYEADGAMDSRLATAIRPTYKKSRVDRPDIPLRDTRRFPDVRPATIGEKDGHQFWDFDRSIPGPKLGQQSSLSQRGASIGEKRPHKEILDTPGPSDYNPGKPSLPVAPRYSCKGFGARDDWIPKKQARPGPGYVNVRKDNELPKWIIGDRSISRSARSTSSQREKLVPDKPHPQKD